MIVANSIGRLPGSHKVLHHTGQSMGSHMGVVNLNDHICVILVMGMAVFHLTFEKKKEKSNVHKGTHFRARPTFGTAFSVI